VGIELDLSPTMVEGGVVRFGSLADILPVNCYVLLYLQVRHSQVLAACPLWANSGHSMMSVSFPFYP
jgi:hypothetical protein